MIEGNYDSVTGEKKWQDFWEKEKIYKFDPDKKGELFSIDTPPPTVSGNMHIGHAFSYAQQDFIARYKRMKGFNVYYPFGTDDNGLPTERLVEKLKKVKSTRMDRPAFVKLCQETVSEIKADFVSDWLRIGMSCDFSSNYSTIDPHSVKTSQKSFLELYKKGLVMKKKAPSMWCVNCQTAIAQAELEDKEMTSTFNDVAFEISGEKEKITIATTRPELLPACVCIFVHPDDERYKGLVGKKAVVPLFNQEVEIFADESAEPEKGSGIMMICSYGDRFDVEAIKKHNLEPRLCITANGKLNNLANQFEGMGIKDAREGILKELQEKGFLLAKKDITHSVNVHDKCQTEIEFLETEQWFVKLLENKDKFMAAGDKIIWHPQSMKIRYNNWVENLNYDWCISRQRHFGVPFPVWYSKKTDEVILADETELPVDPLSHTPKHLPKDHTKDDIVPEKDVMDTWATSSLTPQIIVNWVGDKKHALGEHDFKKYLPVSLRPQGHDIIRTWAFYTIVKSVYHENSIPWKDIMISGNVADPKGEKMSKSKGNVVDPREIMKKYCADALRFWASGSKLGEDLAYQEKDFVTAKKTITKLWNAAKLCYQHLADYDPKDEIGFEQLEIIDQWLLTRFQGVVKESTELFDAYNFSEARKSADVFFWHDFCDYYLEIVKHRLYSSDEEQKVNPAKRKSAQFALHHAFLGIIKMYAPFMPFITEELYQSYYPKKDKQVAKSIHLAGWPEYDGKLISPLAEEAGLLALEIISEVRKHKASKKMSLKEEVAQVIAESPFDLSKLGDKEAGLKEDVIKTIRAKNLEFRKGERAAIFIS